MGGGGTRRSARRHGGERRRVALFFAGVGVGVGGVVNCCRCLLVCWCVGVLFECERVRECFRFVFCLSFTTREDAGAWPGQGRSWHGILAGGRGSHLVSLIAVAVAVAVAAAVHLTLHRSRSLVQKFNLVYTLHLQQ